jgi:alpha-beta hydrolase superfamily lysophospholipase
MRSIFADETFAFEWLRTVGHAPYGAADIGECLAAADQIVDGDLESWHQGWFRTAERVRRGAEASAAGGHRVSACAAYMRASNYYRAAEFFLHEHPGDPRLLATWRASRDTFARAAALLPHPAEAVEIPYEGTTLAGYFYRVDDSAVPRPTLIFHGGLDSTLEELYPAAASAVLARGYHCLTFVGPGQGRTIREQGLPFRPDWERVVTPVVDYALARPEVDAARLALLGWSLGGYLAPRAAAFEHRLAALIAWDGAYDNFAAGLPMLPPEAQAMAEETFARDPHAFDDHFAALMRASTGARWAFTHGMWAFGVASPGELIAAGRAYHLRGLAERISCPTLVCEAEDDPFWQGQPRQLYDALTCPKTFLRFTAEEGAGEHCHVGAHALFHQRAFDWLDEVLR